MTHRDEFTESDLPEVASAVFDDEASENERLFVSGHSSGPAWLAAFAELRNDLREVRDPGEDVFAQMRIRAISAADSAAPIAPPSNAGRPVTNLAAKRSLRSLGPKLVGVAAVAIVGIGAMAIANLDRDSSSQESAALETARTTTDAASGGATAEANPVAPPGDGESGDDLFSDRGGVDDGYLGSFDRVDDLEDSYRQRAAIVASSAPQIGEADESTGGDASGDETAKFLACGERTAWATLAGQEVVVLQAGDQVRVVDAATCAVVATFAP